MLTLSSTGEVLAALRTARNVSVLAYTLRPGSFEDALVAAAQRGAHVRVRLEGQPYNDAQGQLIADNEHAIDVLSRAGADAKLVHRAGSHDAALHAKTIAADGSLFLDDRNWAGDGAETIVRDSFSADIAMAQDAVAGRGDASSPFFAMRKRDALASEARLLRSAHRGDDVCVESESFGSHNRVYDAIDALGRDGVAPRLLVSSRDVQGNVREEEALEQLKRDGVQVRVYDADEKFSLVNARGWLGSANASAAFDEPDQLDWGARTDAPPIIDHLRSVFEARWKNAQPFTSSRAPA